VGDVGRILADQKRRREMSQKPQLSESEAGALAKMRAEAEKHGATLATDGKGGLSPSRVLGQMRKDKYRCPACGGHENLSVHHKYKLENPHASWSRKSSGEIRNAITTICEKCHDRIHDRDRDEGQDQFVK
jgi:phage terminase large subunit GpA-like protein